MRSALILLVLLTLVLTACAQALSDPDLQSTMQIAITLTSLVQTPMAPATTEAPPAATSEFTSEPPVPIATESSGPEVVYLDVFGDAQAQIQGRVVEPFILYYRTTPDYPTIVSITIETVPDVPDYPYKAEAIFQGGGNAGWLIHVTGGLVDWWLPECMDACPLSDEFRSAYPEIVAILEP